MRRTGLFKKIFEKHLKKGIEPLEQMAEDVGSLKGIFSFKGYDVNTGKIITEQSFDNMLVNESKSSIIRLLGQGRSRYLPNAINPADFRINKMRFSNDIGNAEGSGLITDKINRVLGHNKYEYYSMAENSHRISYVNDNMPGGAYNLTSNILETNDTAFKTEYTTEQLDALSSKIISDAQGNKIIGIKTIFLSQGETHPVRPPSHGSIKAIIYKNNQIIEEIYFDYKMGTKDEEIIPTAYYNKNQETNKPFKIINYQQADGKYYHVTTPTSNASTYVTEGNKRICYINDSNNFTNTRIFYDYYTDPVGWKLYLNELPTTTAVPNSLIANTIRASFGGWDKIEVVYTTGLYNTVNLVIPKQGVNLGKGRSSAVRYGGNNQDYYLISDPTEDNYRDSNQDFIDDYSITFSVLMNAQDGNGQATTTGRAIKYKKAYLHTANDQLFSSILIPTSDFEKSSGVAYVINWRILAPVN